MFLWSGILFGLMGSMHCVAMCGPIALALPVGGESTFKKTLLILFYNLGRAAMYALLGLVAGLTGAGIVLAGYQQLLSVIAGILLIVSAFFPVFRKAPIFTPYLNRLKNAIGEIFRRKEKKDLFVLGLLNGLLPCGLVFMALAVAMASGTMYEGATFMFLFGIGTFPLMVAMPFAGSYLSQHVRKTLRKAVPLIIGTMGIVLLLRGLNLGIPYLSPRFHESGIPACHQVSSNQSINSIPCTGHDSQATK